MRGVCTVLLLFVSATCCSQISSPFTTYRHIADHNMSTMSAIHCSSVVLVGPSSKIVFGDGSIQTTAAGGGANAMRNPSTGTLNMNGYDILNVNNITGQYLSAWSTGTYTAGQLVVDGNIRGTGNLTLGGGNSIQSIITEMSVSLASGRRFSVYTGGSLRFLVHGGVGVNYSQDLRPLGDDEYHLGFWGANTPDHSHNRWRSVNAVTARAENMTVMTGIYGGDANFHFVFTTTGASSYRPHWFHDIVRVSTPGIRFADGTVMVSTSGFGNGGWNGTATSELNMNGYDILNARNITGQYLSAWSTGTYTAGQLVVGGDIRGTGNLTLGGGNPIQSNTTEMSVSLASGRHFSVFTGNTLRFRVHGGEGINYSQDLRPLGDNGYDLGWWGTTLPGHSHRRWRSVNTITTNAERMNVRTGVDGAISHEFHFVFTSTGASSYRPHWFHNIVHVSTPGIRFADGTVMVSTSGFGNGGWNGTATSNLNMSGYNIVNVQDIYVSSVNTDGITTDALVYPRNASHSIFAMSDDHFLIRQPFTTYYLQLGSNATGVRVVGPFSAGQYGEPVLLRTITSPFFTVRSTGTQVNGALYITSGYSGEDIHISNSASASYIKAGNTLMLQAQDAVLMSGNSSGEIYLSTSITGSGAYSLLRYNTSNGRLYYDTSTRRNKRNIRTYSIPRSALKGLSIRKFTEVSTGRESIGLIAEELHEAGLSDVVVYDDAGKIVGVAYEKIPLLLIPVLQEQQARIERLERAVVAITSGTFATEFPEGLPVNKPTSEQGGVALNILAILAAALTGATAGVIGKKTLRE